VDGVRHVYLHALDLHRSAFVELHDVLGALRVQRVNQLDHADDGRAALLRDRDRIRDVIEVPMRDEDHVEVARILHVVRAPRIVVEERIDQDPLA
jgi:hypothetical protein